MLLALLFVGTSSAAAAPRSDPAEVAVAAAFRAALKNDFQAYLAVVHASEKASPQQVSQLERYTFGRFVRQAAWYLSGRDPESFQVERREELGGGKVKMFLKDLAHPSRASVPVTLEKSGAVYLLLANSL
jgi:hypothetical protein